MISKDAAEKIISESLDEIRLRRIIRNTSVVAWNKEISDIQIDRWLENFDGGYFISAKNEKKLALWLLAHFTYYTYGDVRILCRNLFNQYLHVKLQNHRDEDVADAVTDIIKNTVFIGLGNDSESGNNILYYFRQENQLPKTCFEIRSGHRYKNLVYIDDVTISGSQAIEYINTRNIDAENVYAALLIATESAIIHLSDSGIGIKPIATMILDERDQTFSDKAYVFSDKRVAAIKPFAREFCEWYGSIATKGCGYMEKHPLGYKNGQYMIGFEYNMPDNTLPIFWGTGGGWIPLFKRYQKIYNGERYIPDGRKYF
ncbi:MAG: hypothetical protein NC489_38325 [Ruminococcus flavefaciens]|nr:hypothetical protein [Ruminococcus flavefaciens]